MAKSRKFLAILLSIVCCICCAFLFTACGKDDEQNTNGSNNSDVSTDDGSDNLADKDILAVYNTYVAYSQENGNTPLSYEEWLLSIKGEKGDKGDTGAQGIQGEKGDKGDTGAQGIQGEKGDKGDTGAQGIQGEKGEKGDTGAQGIQGEKGDKGDTGAQGIQGEKGDTGAQGIQGEKGDKGDTGAQGIQGEKGDKGDTGLGIKSAVIDSNGDLIITFDDDTFINAGNVVNKSDRLNNDNKIVFNTLTVSDDTVYGKVSNETEVFYFTKEIALLGNASYTVYTDITNNFTRRISGYNKDIDRIKDNNYSGYAIFLAYNDNKSMVKHFKNNVTTVGNYDYVITQI